MPLTILIDIFYFNQDLITNWPTVVLIKMEI